MTSEPLYDEIGRTYATARQPDPRIAAQIEAALDDARRVVNVGAGAGSYEPTGRDVVAVEPSPVMIGQRPPGSAPALRAVAERLPFPTASFDAALAVLTVHHWADPAGGLRELQRVASRQVVLTWDPGFLNEFWFTRDYVPDPDHVDDDFVTLEPTAAALGPSRIEVVPVPHDCIDGFYAAYWRRPEAYFDPRVRAGISGFHLADPQVVEDSLRRLRADLDSGEWARRNADLLDRDELDLGYRLVIAG
jgi:SAM-dependent methyltransferase